MEQLDTKYPDGWIPCRRFAVWQREKWRPIDDFLENSVNSCYSVCDKIDLKALDETVWTAMTIMRLVRGKGHFSFHLKDGTRLSGKLHEAWTEHPELARPVVKTFDLKSAYKQFAISPKEYSKAILCLKDPDSSEVRGFGCLTLPFGAISSVVCFNRVARLFQRILQELCVLASNYFDDYPVLEFKQLAGSSHSTVVTVASLLGFRLAQDKDEPAALCADLLGVTLDLSDDRLLEVRIANKKSRVAEMSKSLQTVLEEGKVVTSSLPAIFGRLQFCEGQLLGRQGKLALADIRILEKSNQRVSVIDALCRDALRTPPSCIGLH